ncbi:hypothetical protein D187_004450 [Cystobacter fuscus DSM 2262]|uniref:Uncharacterized protein n=1 Tax=Cystobacter fuscus (strain ATCC 25194 / DSM 2262 / NBRC 100088 / M29) TaxID=1242864 RepID=S9P415_CYSF2|nr:hypothetical protein D187_004450 [Cystobacter fuscus DSM 2262]
MCRSTRKKEGGKWPACSQGLSDTEQSSPSRLSPGPRAKSRCGPCGTGCPSGGVC